MTESLDEIAPEERAAFLEYRAKVSGANISEQTLLATDYLNHFNEIVMLIEMLPDMPDMIEDAKAWQPKTYAEHFRGSSFSDKELAIAAYDRAPSIYKKPFEGTVAAMDQLVLAMIRRLDAAIAEGADGDTLRAIVSSGSRNLQRLMDVASGVIHGAKKTLDQEEIDRLIEG